LIVIIPKLLCVFKISIKWDLQACFMKHQGRSIVATKSKNTHPCSWTFYIMPRALDYFWKTYEKHHKMDVALTCMYILQVFSSYEHLRVNEMSKRSMIICIEFEQHLLIELKTYHLVHHTRHDCVSNVSITNTLTLW
jgi:hypothetical protein